MAQLHLSLFSSRFFAFYVFCTEIAWISWDLRYVWNCLNSDSMIFPPRHSTSISSLRQSLACQVDDVWLLRYVLSFKDCWRLGCRDRMTFECKRIAENDFKSHSLITWLSIKEITWNFVVKAKHWIQEAFAEWVILATSKLLASFCDRRGRSDAVIGRCCPDQDDLPAAIHAAKAAITWRRERENFGRWSTLFVFFSFLCIVSYAKFHKSGGNVSGLATKILAWQKKHNHTLWWISHEQNQKRDLAT